MVLNCNAAGSIIFQLSVLWDATQDEEQYTFFLLFSSYSHFLELEYRCMDFIHTWITVLLGCFLSGIQKKFTTDCKFKEKI